MSFQNRLKSFVLRRGKITSNQSRALSEHWDKYILDNEEILFVGGAKNPTARLWVRNLTTGVHKRCNLKNGGNFLNYLLDGKTEDMTVSKGGPDSGGKYYLFIARAGHLFGFELAEDTNGLWCPKELIPKGTE